MSHNAFLYKIRLAYQSEWAEIMRFVWKAFMQSEGKKCSDEGRESFFNFIADNALKDSFMEGEYPVFLALDGDSIIGVAAIRYHNHLSLLFVDEGYWRKGVGSKLLQTAMQYVRGLGERYISLQAVSDAVMFYRKQGFRVIRPEEEFSSIRVTCMEKYF